MAQFKNTWTGGVITVPEEAVEMYERRSPEWERVDDAASAKKTPARRGGNKSKAGNPPAAK